MGGASHGSSRPVRTFPFDLITLNHFAHIFHFFSWLFNFLYVTCVMVNKAVKKKKKKVQGEDKVDSRRQKKFMEMTAKSKTSSIPLHSY